MQTQHETQYTAIREDVVRQLEQYSVEVLEAVLSILQQQELLGQKG